MIDATALVAQLKDRTSSLIGGDFDARLGLAVSGGPDSIAMLHMASLAFPECIACVTVDHGLRPESSAEAAMVGQLCQTLAVPHYVLTIQTPVTGNVQAWARKQRYAAMDQWMLKEDVAWLLTAHHADDQLETILMRMNRGAGVSGLSGIRARTGNRIRPMLGMRKADLLAYVQGLGLPYVDDPSNSDVRFDRVALRQQLQSVDWIDRQAVARSAAAVAEAEDALEWAVAALAAEHVSVSEESVTLHRTNIPRELLRRMILHMIQLADPSADGPRGRTLDLAIHTAQMGRQQSIGIWLLSGGPTWQLRLAPKRRDS